MMLTDIQLLEKLGAGEPDENGIYAAACPVCKRPGSLRIAFVEFDNGTHEVQMYCRAFCEARDIARAIGGDDWRNLPPADFVDSRIDKLFKSDYVDAFETKGLRAGEV